jgi:hypothetical protein
MMEKILKKQRQYGNVSILILLGLIMLLLLGFCAYLLLKNYDFQKKNTQPAVVKTALPENFDTSTWKVYHNDKYNFEIKYPSSWDAGENRPEDKSRLYLMFDNKPLTTALKTTFYYEGRYDGLLIYARWGELHEDSDLTSPSSDPGVVDSGRIWNKTKVEKITFAGAPAVKTTQEAPFQFDEFDHGNQGGTTIIFNYQGIGWTISYMNTDFKGSHDPVYDQILATFKFIPPEKVETKTYINKEFQFSVDYPTNWTIKTQNIGGNTQQGFVNFGGPDQSEGLVTIAWGGGFGGGPCLGQHQKIETKAGIIDMCKTASDNDRENLSRANDAQGETYKDRYTQAFMFAVTDVGKGQGATAIKILKSFTWL